jgi:hypothetical protein
MSKLQSFWLGSHTVRGATGQCVSRPVEGKITPRLVCIATHYWLDGPGIESRWEGGFTHPSRPALEPKQTPVQRVPGHNRG